MEENNKPTPFLKKKKLSYLGLILENIASKFVNGNSY